MFCLEQRRRVRCLLLLSLVEFAEAERSACFVQTDCSTIGGMVRVVLQKGVREKTKDRLAFSGVRDGSYWYWNGVRTDGPVPHARHHATIRYDHSCEGEHSRALVSPATGEIHITCRPFS